MNYINYSEVKKDIFANLEPSENDKYLLFDDMLKKLFVSPGNPFDLLLMLYEYSVNYTLQNKIIYSGFESWLISIIKKYSLIQSARYLNNMNFDIPQSNYLKELNKFADIFLRELCSFVDGLTYAVVTNENYFQLEDFLKLIYFPDGGYDNIIKIVRVANNPKVLDIPSPIYMI